MCYGKGFIGLIGVPVDRFMTITDYDKTTAFQFWICPFPPSFLLPPPAAPYLATTVSPAASTYTRARVVEGMQSYVPSERVTPVLLLPTADAWYCVAYGVISK